VVACEEVLAAGLEPCPLLPLRELREPRRPEPPLRLVYPRRKQQPKGERKLRSIREGGGREEGRRKKERQTGVVPTAWKAVGDALRKSTRSETTGATAAIGGGGGSRRGDGSAEAGRSVWTARKTEARNDEAQERNQLARPREGVFFSLFV
jgi:hypothetical protein